MSQEVKTRDYIVKSRKGAQEGSIIIFLLFPSYKQKTKTKY